MLENWNPKQVTLVVDADVWKKFCEYVRERNTAVPIDWLDLQDFPELCEALGESALAYEAREP